MGDIFTDTTSKRPEPQASLTGLRPADRSRARRIIRHINFDISLIISRAVGVTLSNSPDIAQAKAGAISDDLEAMTDWPGADLAIAQDVLNDSDLLSVLQSRGGAKLPIANRRRASVSISVKSARIRFTDGQALALRSANDHVQRSRKAESLEADDSIQDGLIRRRDLPAHVVEALIAARCDGLAARLVIKHGLAPHLAKRLADKTQQRAGVILIEDDYSALALDTIAGAMLVSGRLVSSVVVRAAGAGRLRFAQNALARRAGISHAKAALMLYAPGDIGFSALVTAAKISPLDVQILRVATHIYRELETAGIEYDRAYFQRLMIDRVLALPVRLSDDDGDYVLDILDGHGALEFH